MSWLSKIFTGYDLDEEQARVDSLDAQLTSANKEDYGAGGQIYDAIAARDGTTVADQNYALTQQHLADSRTADVAGDVGAAFKEGLQEGYSNVTGGISAALKAPFRFAWDAIPWPVWLAGIGFLFFYVGGFTWLARLIKGKLNG